MVGGIVAFGLLGYLLEAVAALFLLGAALAVVLSIVFVVGIVMIFRFAVRQARNGNFHYAIDVIAAPLVGPAFATLLAHLNILSLQAGTGTDAKAWWIVGPGIFFCWIGPFIAFALLSFDGAALSPIARFWAYPLFFAFTYYWAWIFFNFKALGLRW